MSGKKSREIREKEFLRKVKELAGDDYLLLSEYTYNDSPVTMRHKNCGKEFEILPKSFTSLGSRCRHCSRELASRKISKKLLSSHNDFERKLKTRQGENTFSLLSKYKSSAEKIKVRHNCILCNNHEGWVIAGQLLQKGCPSMKHKKKKLKNGWIIYCEIPLASQKFDGSHKGFLEKINGLPHGNQVKIIGNYISARHKIKIQCLRCNDTLVVNPQQVLLDVFCRNCGIKKKNKSKTTPLSEMIKRLDEWYGEGHYSIVNPKRYKNSITHTTFKHNICGHEWEATMCNVVRGFGCPQCNIVSKGESWVENILNEHQIPFKKEQSFPELRKIRPLRFDFSILEPCGEIRMLIEYNGIQHYKEAPFFSRLSLRERRDSDRAKFLYAKEKRIPLCIIPFQYNTREKIERLMSKNKVI